MDEVCRGSPTAPRCHRMAAWRAFGRFDARSGVRGMTLQGGRLQPRKVQRSAVVSCHVTTQAHSYVTNKARSYVMLHPTHIMTPDSKGHVTAYSHVTTACKPLARPTVT